MRRINTKTRFTIALATTGTVAVASAGMALGAHVFAPAKAPDRVVPSRVVIARVPDRVVVARVPARVTKPRPAAALNSFEGKLSVDDGVLKLKVLRVFGPTRGSQLSWQLLDRKAYLATGALVQLRDARGALIPLGVADDAIVRVQGKLLPTGSWRWDEDELRPVISVQRIVILRLEID
jgi:hypothetical protein